MALRKSHPAEVPEHELRALAQLAVKEERYEDAAQAYKALLATCPSDGDALHGLGVRTLGNSTIPELMPNTETGGIVFVSCKVHSGGMRLNVQRECESQ